MLKLCFTTWAVVLSTAISIGANAALFTPGNLAVYRVGDGVAAISPTSTTPSVVFIDEYTPAGALVQSFKMPTAASGTTRALTAQPNASLEGLIKTSADGQYLTFTGYDFDLGGTVPPSPGNGTLAQSIASAIPRTVGRIDAAGNVDTTTTYNDSGQGSPRSAISDNGTNLWIAQGSIGSGSDGRIRHTTIGSTGASTAVTTSASSTDPRAIGIFDGQLYGSTQSSGTGTTTNSPIYSIGSGLPTSTGQTTTGLPGIAGGTGPNFVDFYLADLSPAVPGMDTLYVTGDGTAAITKYSLVGTTWTNNGTVGVNTDDYRGLAATVSGTTVTLFATKVNGDANPDQLVKLVDASGYNSTITGLVPSILVTLPNNTMLFKGIAMAPVAVPEVSAVAMLGLVGAMAGIAKLRRRSKAAKSIE